MRGYVEWLENEARERPEDWEPTAEEFNEAMRERVDAARDEAKWK
jgi:hypothetical protein